MQPIHVLYQEFIEKLRALIDSQANFAKVEFKTDSRWLTVWCMVGENDAGERDCVYRVEYGHLDRNNKVRMHFKEVPDLHAFVRAAIWKNPRYATLRKDFNHKDYFRQNPQHMLKVMKRMHETKTVTTTDFFKGCKGAVKDNDAVELTLHVKKDHAGNLFVVEH
ncbi:hypothetical protein AVA65_07860 [Salmonella enterica subsp. enterica serovar Minnesota]|nr:hypothetical protein [Salmonella enterica subsp. enterica serovar Minnesota]